MKRKSTERVPEYLREFVVEQDYDSYTSKDHAAWRFIMRQSLQYFATHAHQAYLKGLEATGISNTRIPKISEIDAALGEFGWGAVCVRGFIPPSAFLMFQASKLLPIAADMRSSEHIAYTSAPDIVHEAAGHAPILADETYATYLTRYANLARHAIFSDEDLALYEAIRVLSDLKENPDSTAEEIEKADFDLKKATEGITWVSESAMVARMSWWTIEYGLIGSLDDPKIYGAGLLSSVGEAMDCLTAKIKKIPLTLDCINQSYDITEPQPQLYVAESFEHMLKVLGELEEKMAFKKGGIASAELALKANSISTLELDHGLFAISGSLGLLWSADSQDGVSFLSWSSGVQISEQGQELRGFSRSDLPTGVSLFMQGSATTDYIDMEKEVNTGTLEFTRGGIELSGEVAEKLVTQKGELIGCKFKNLRVSFEGNQYEFPERHLLFCQQIKSVYGGPADWKAFGNYNMGDASTQPGRLSPFSAAEIKSFDFYSRIRELRKKSLSLDTAECTNKLNEMLSELKRQKSDEWLAAIELLEVVTLVGQRKKMECTELATDLHAYIDQVKERLDERSQKMLELGRNSLAFVSEEELKMLEA